MSIIRIKKQREYVSIANAILQNKTLTWEARGIMAYLLSKPDGWECRNYDLVNQGPAGEHTIKRILKELREAGYIHRFKISKGRGKIQWITEIYETPDLNPNFTTGDFTTVETIEVESFEDEKSADIVSTDSSKYLPLENTDLSPSAENELHNQSSGDFGDPAKGNEPILVEPDALTEAFGPNPRQAQSNGKPPITEADAAHLLTFGHLPGDKPPWPFDTIQEIRQSGWEIWDPTVERGVAYCLEAIRTKKPDFAVPNNTRSDWHKDVRGHLKDYKVDDLGTLYKLAVDKLNKAGMSYTRPGSLTRTLPDVANAPAPTNTGPTLTEAQKARLAELTAQNKKPR